MSTYSLPALASQALDLYIDYLHTDTIDDPPLIAALSDVYHKNLLFAYDSQLDNTYILSYGDKRRDESMGITITHSDEHDPELSTQLHVDLRFSDDDRHIDKGRVQPTVRITITDQHDRHSLIPLFGYIHSCIMGVRIPSTLLAHTHITTLNNAPAS